MKIDVTPIELALRFMEIFFSGERLHRLESILHDDLQFRGPFYQFNSAQDYIASLIANPPQECNYQIIHAFEQENAVNLVYNFSKPGVSTIMSQLFEKVDGKISRIVLIFDSAAFTGK